MKVSGKFQKNVAINCCPKNMKNILNIDRISNYFKPTKS